MKVSALLVAKGGQLLPIKGTLHNTLGLYWVGVITPQGYTAIDRGSGYIICQKKTRPECEAFIAENAKRIAEIQETKSYRAQMLKVEAALSKYKGGA